MAPVFVVFLFFSLRAVSAEAADEEIHRVSAPVTEVLEKVNAGVQRLKDGDIMQSVHRNADPCSEIGCKWPKRGDIVRIPVSFDSSYSTEELNTIIDALLAFHEHTCIRFVRRKRRHRQFIHFFSGTGCWSYIGRLRGGQMISIMRNGCVFKSTVQHEVLHALAFHHEHARSDRDEHVEILWENIIPGRESNFDKEDTNNLETSYDFGSVMHYTKTAFSRNNEPTIQAKDATIDSFGEATEMSSNDIARVNRLYNCN
ncbi:uncharacterized protein V6R79_005790 [Siganus canaliculatus]